MDTHQPNPPIARLLWGVTAVEAAVLLVSGGVLLILPAALRGAWPWALPPFNAAFLGAVYLAALVAAALLVLKGRWAPARVMVPMILLFTATVLLVSLAYLDRFDLRSPSTWLWFALYAGIPANAAYHLWRARRLPPASPRRLSPGWRAGLLAQALVMGAYSAGLMLAPETWAGFWPWPVDAFHARLYSATFVTPALGALLLVRAAARDEALALGLTQAVLGAAPILGLVAVDAGAQRVDWAAGGTWVWIGLLAAISLVGAGLTWTSGARRRPWAPRAAAARLVSPRGAAALIGVAFTAAGVAGFLPALTPPPPPGVAGFLPAPPATATWWGCSRSTSCTASSTSRWGSPACWPAGEQPWPAASSAGSPSPSAG